MLSTRFRGAGFSLIEALIVLAIMGIIAAFAVPQYQAQVTKTKRSDGMQMLMSMMQTQERYFTNELTYATNLTLLGYASAANVASSEGHYQITATACAGDTIARCVILTAVPQGSQAADGNLTLNSRGQRTGNWD